MCCPNSQTPRRMSEKEIEMRARWRREREAVLTRAYSLGATPAQLDTLSVAVQAVEAKWIGQDTLPGFSEVFATKGTIIGTTYSAAEDTTVYVYSDEPVVITPPADLARELVPA